MKGDWEMEIYTPIYSTDEDGVQHFSGWCLSRLSGLMSDPEAWDSKNYILTIPESHAEDVADTEGGTTLLEGPVISINPIADDRTDTTIRPSIKKLIIPSSVQIIGGGAFYGCRSLESITVAPTNSEYAVWNNVLYSKDFSQLILVPASLREPSIYNGQKTDFVRVFTCHPNTREILEGACSGTKFYTVHIFGSVECIHKNAFEDAIFLREIRLGDSVKNIEEKAFANCYSVETLALGNGLEKIASKAFENCIMLNMLRLPRNLQAIYSQAFAGCTGLATVKYSTTGTQFFKYDGALVAVELEDLKTFITVGDSTMGEALYGLYGNQFEVTVNITNEENEGDE